MLYFHSHSLTAVTALPDYNILLDDIIVKKSNT